MSLNIYLETDNPASKAEGSGIFVRENGLTKEISPEEWNQKDTSSESVGLSSFNITNNLTEMAEKCGAYQAVWNPEELGISTAAQITEYLVEAIAKLKDDPEYYKQFNPSNGWGDYEGLLETLENYYEACCRYPSARIRTWK